VWAPSTPDGIAKAFDDLYDEVISWERNLFFIPFGSSAERFVRILSYHISQFAADNTGSSYSWTAVVCACHLLLQRPFKDSKAADHVKHLERRAELWRRGDLSALKAECQCIQRHLPVRSSRSSNDSINDAAFANYVHQGRIGAAARYLSRETGGVLGIDEDCGSGRTAYQVLQDKHPTGVPATPSTLLQEEYIPPNPVLFESITSKKIRQVGINMSGSAGPSGADSAAWSRMLSVYGKASSALCESLAAAARRLCSSEVPGRELKAFLAARLIPLAKNPGVRPIAVGEVFRRIIGKAIMIAIESDVAQATAPVGQLCVGVPSACEVAVSALTSMFSDPAVEGILLVDATNAFNSINRAACLHNIPRICPAAGRVFMNTYSSEVSLYIDGGRRIMSTEGTCQGDPLAMAFYALATVPLVQKLASKCPDARQTWYADDDAAAATVASLHKYWESMESDGPRYGYYPNASKTILLVKPSAEEEARRLFGATNIQIPAGAASEKVECPPGAIGIRCCHAAAGRVSRHGQGRAKQVAVRAAGGGVRWFRIRAPR